MCVVENDVVRVTTGIKLACKSFEMSLTQSLFYVMFGQHVLEDIYTENIRPYIFSRVNIRGDSASH